LGEITNKVSKRNGWNKKKGPSARVSESDGGIIVINKKKKRSNKTEVVSIRGGTYQFRLERKKTTNMSRKELLSQGRRQQIL